MIVELASPPSRGQYSITVVHLCVDLVVQAAATMRGAVVSLELIVERFSLNVVTPSFTAIRWWLLRIGCHALTCALPNRAAWVWLIDHTVQIGAAKLLVVVGCLLSDVPFGERALQHADLRLVHLALMEHSTAETMSLELEKAALRTGIPREIASDEGSDLIGGVAEFRLKAEIAHVHDMAHQAANVLKQRWNGEARWNEFVGMLSQTSNKIRQTQEAYLLPPAKRAKARFMNVGPTLRFAGRLLKLLETNPSERIERHYSWLREYRDDVLRWADEQAACELVVRHVGQHGVNRETADVLQAKFALQPLSDGACEVVKKLLVRVRAMGEQAAEGETLVASTEVLESLLGKLKRLEGSYANDGFTSLSLAMGSLVGERTEAETRAAMEAVPEKQVTSLIERIFGTTVHMLRYAFTRP